MCMLLSVVAALAFAAFAFYRSTRAGGYYDGAIYNMQPRTHRLYALVGAALAALIAMAYTVRAQTLAFGLDAALTIVAVFYLTSFLRGAHEEA